MPPTPKPEALRQRRNKTSTSATLSSDHNVQAPPLPRGRKWQDETIAWWADIWSSPMAPEYLEADQHGLFSLAILEDDFWALTNFDFSSIPDLLERLAAQRSASRSRTALLAEIRLQRQCYGLTPIDRRRLQWQVEQGDAAAAKTKKRKDAAETPLAPPREIRTPKLGLVKTA